jgi:hypothetical protein
MDERTIVPVRHNGKIIGKAEVSPDCVVISVELDEGEMPKYIRDMIYHDLADGLSLGVSMKPVLPLPYSRESYTKRWL